MGIEHERIHLETSSVLIRQLPLKYVVPAPNFGECNERGEYDESPKNALHPVPARTITQGKDNGAKSFSWDNEYGSLKTVLPAFRASKYLVSNREFADFVSANGYRRKEFWSEEGQRWLAYTKAECPTFWRKVGYMGFRRYNHRHSIKIPDGKCAWTLLFVGPKREVKLHSKYAKNP